MKKQLRNCKLYILFIHVAIMNKKNKKNIRKAPFSFFKNRKGKKRAEGLTKLFYDLGLNDSPTEKQYAKTRASVKNEKQADEKSISSSFSVSLPVSLL